MPPIEQALLSLAHSLSMLVPRANQDKPGYHQILSLVNGLSGEAYSLEAALDAYVKVSLIPSFRGKIEYKQPNSLSLYQSLGEWLRLRPNDCIDFNCREHDLVSGLYLVNPDTRFETREEAAEDRAAYEALLAMEGDASLIFNEEHSEYHSTERPDEDLSELIKTTIILWPQMASVLLEKINLFKSAGAETFRIMIDFDPENGSSLLQCYATFDSDEKRDAFHDNVLVTYPAGDRLAFIYIQGPSYLSCIRFQASSDRVRYLRNGRKAVAERKRAAEN